MFDLKLTLKLTSAATFDQIWAWGLRPQALLQRRGREILENVEPPRLLTAAQIFLEKDVDSTKTRTHNCNATQLKHLPTSGNPLVAFIQLREPSILHPRYPNPLGLLPPFSQRPSHLARTRAYLRISLSSPRVLFFSFHHA